MTETVVVDASVIVDLLTDAPHAPALRARLRDTEWCAPPHLDSEVLSSLGRWYRAGRLGADQVEARIALQAGHVIDRRPMTPLMVGAWARRGSIRLTDALYVELAAQLGAPLITTDRRLARATPLAETVGP